MRKLWRSIILIPVILAILVIGIAWSFRFEFSYWRNQAIIDKAAMRYNVPAKLVGALIWQETRFNAACRGKAGEIGLMQIMPASAGEWAKAEKITPFDPGCLRDPQTNVLAGTWYLARSLKRWAAQTDPVPYALAEYNAGRSNALRWERHTNDNPEHFTELISYPSTRNYVTAIIKHYRSFGRPWERW